jgi:hypothetical protein
MTMVLRLCLGEGKFTVKEGWQSGAAYKTRKLKTDWLCEFYRDAFGTKSRSSKTIAYDNRRRWKITNDGQVSN